MRNPATHTVALRTVPATDDPLSSMVDAISQGNREAFAVLVDRTAEAIGAELTATVADTRQRAAILAATYVEVWWLAGCRSSAEPDVPQWIRRILHRRVIAAPGLISPRTGGDRRPSRAELELAALLDRPVDRLWTARPAEVTRR
jgi:hypothetical protein